MEPVVGNGDLDSKLYANLNNPLHPIGVLLDARWVHPNRSARNHLSAMAAFADLPERRVDEVLGMVLRRRDA